MPGERANGFRDDPAAPVGLAEPVAHFDRAVGDILLSLETDTTGGFAVHDDGEVRNRVFRTGVPDPGRRVFEGIRMGKTIAQIARYLQIVRVADKCLGVAAAPFTNEAVAETDFHGSCGGSNPEHRTSRFEPNNRT